MVSSIIPPKIASPNAIGAAADAVRMQRVVDFYEKLPRGKAPEPKARGLLGWYKARYFGGRGSAMPLVHVIGTMMVLGYAQNYYFHLRQYTSTSITVSLDLLPVPWRNQIFPDNVRDIVMAEQINHNVVNQTESTSGSASLVDIAANLNTTASAEFGTQDFTANPISDDKPVLSAIKTPPGISVAAVSDATAEPSAGNAIAQPDGDIDFEDGRKSADSLLPTEPADETASLDISADPSVNSDTDISRQDAAELARDGAQHSRTNSVKKPAFSRVSVTKNFLAKSAVSTPVAAKPGDKAVALAAVQPAALRPRLIAKTAASLSNLSRTRLGTEASASPDASKVWNKNRPAPTVPPKQFTDEELKQQYGIHLATRLQSDDAGKGSKWADIDDDEDDWAPEAVVWMDGTKSTLTPSESTPIPVEVKTTTVPPKAAEAQKPSLVLSKKSSQTLGTAKTILKPGASVQAKQQGGAPSATTAEKQVLIAKGPALTPSKSPWAPLPPVEKVSPINPPVQVQSRYQPPFPSQDARGGDFSTISSQPAREIAADTFDRSWPVADSETRELFNSANGKYEPVPEGRRNSIRNDGSRKHAVLRRPSHGVSGAEPLANAHGNVPWAQRRGSNISQGSGPFQRPISVTQSIDSHGAPSTAAGTERDASGQPLASATSTWAQQLPPPPAAGEEAEDPVKVQERVMREKREAARQRRQAEEAQEEAAKQARLKAKLEALAGAGLSRKERQQAGTVSTGAETLTAPGTDSTGAQPTDHAEDAAQSETKAASSAGPSFLLDEVSRASTQAPSVQTPSPTLEKAAITEPSPQLAQRENVAASAASRSTYQSQVSGSYQTAPSSAFSSPGDRERKPQPFSRAPLQNHDGFSSPWPTASSGGNVWGVKGIGNGTFESAFAPISSHHQALSLPPPPGMVRPTTTNRISPQTLGSSGHSPSLQNAQLQDQHRALPASDLDLRPDHFSHQPRMNGLSPNQGLGRQQHVPGPIGPPSRTQQHANHSREAVSAWQSAAQQLPSQYARDAEASDRLRQDDSSTEVRRNTNRFKETFKETHGNAGGLGGPRRFDRTDYTMHEGGVSTPLPPSIQSQSMLQSGATDAMNRPGESNVRLPNPSQNALQGAIVGQQSGQAGLHLNASNKVAFATMPLAPGPQINDEVPPPPEISSHPVFEGDHYRPSVRLPPTPAVVKLPPTDMPGRSSNQHLVGQRQNQPFGNVGGARPIVQNEAWQARFNGLFNRTPIQTETPPSPPRTPPKQFATVPALAVASITRAAMEESLAGPTVSLPRAGTSDRSEEGFIVDDSEEVTSKAMVGSMFAEELGFGSRPAVRIPRNVSPGSSSLAHINLLAVRPNSREVNHVNPQTQSDLPVFNLFYKKPDAYYIKLPSMVRSKICFTRSQKAKPIKGKPTKPMIGKSPASASSEFTKASASSSGPPNSRKASAFKSPAAAASGDASPSFKKHDAALSAPKTLRKRSSQHRNAVKTGIATENTNTPIKAA